MENIEDREAFKGDEKNNQNSNVNGTSTENEPKNNEISPMKNITDDNNSETSPVKIINISVDNKNDSNEANQSTEKMSSEQQVPTNQNPPTKEIPASPNENSVKSDRPLPKYGIPSWDKDCLISLQRQQNRRRK